MRKATTKATEPKIPRRAKAMPSPHASQTDMFVLLCRKKMNIEMIKEFRFHPKRQWRFDYAIPEQQIAIEVEGGVFKKRKYLSKRTGELITTIGGRHNSVKGFIGDMEKYNAAALLGWRVFRVQPDGLCTRETINLIKEALLTGKFVFFAEKCV